MESSFFIDIGIAVVCSAVLSWLALFLRQPIIIAYIVCGIIVGPWGLSWIRNVDFVDDLAHIGIPLLLFLAGLDLKPRDFVKLLKGTLAQTLLSCFFIGTISFIFAYSWGYPFIDSSILGLAFMFSSTILVVKLMPTTTLHQKNLGALCIAILLAQDIIAVGVLMFISGAKGLAPLQLMLLPVKGVFLLGFALLCEQFVVRKMMHYCDEFHETLFLLSLGWCLGIAMLAKQIGFSYEVGAFIAGISLARSPIALFLAGGLKFFRDFFLVLFFFILGAKLDLYLTGTVFLPAIILSMFLIFVKPWIFYGLFRFSGNTGVNIKEASIRLGQASEFTLIIAIIALQMEYISPAVSQLIQLATIFTMILSSYRVVYSYPTPVGVREKLRRD